MSASREPDALPITEHARAKINLTLHVGPPRDDGYHPLSSLVVFADIGDELTLRAADEWALTIDGPFGAGLEADASNLILSAARWAQERWGAQPGHFHLAKNLPIASGIGGGSADAAAALRALARRDGVDVSLLEGTATLGADVPVCLQSKTTLMSGIGEKLNFVDSGEMLHAVLINPLKSVSTGAIFRAYDQTKPRQLSKHPVVEKGLLSAAKAGRNDLESIASQICPDIDIILQRLCCEPGVHLARMSGSGATCFAIVGTANKAQELAKALKAEHTGWWVKPTQFGNR